MKRKLLTGIALALLAVAPALRAVSAEMSPPIAAVAGSKVDSAGRGRELYVQYCSRCHGTDMVTAGNFAYDLRQFPRDAEKRFVQSVMHGKNGRMPPWGDLLSTGDVDALWAYVKTGARQ
jgi:mono/diheme cytochrome c family protein